MKKKASLKVNIKYYSIIFALSAFIIGWIAACAWLFGKWIEASFILVSFFALRYTFVKTYHNKSAGMCTFISIAIFWIAIPVTLPIKTSLFAGVITGFIICFICYLVQDYADKKEENKLITAENQLLVAENKQLELLNRRNIYDMTQQEFVDLCKHKGLDDQETQIADIILRKKLKGQNLYRAIGYSVAQTQRIRKRIIQKFANDINVI